MRKIGDVLMLVGFIVVGLALMWLVTRLQATFPLTTGGGRSQPILPQVTPTIYPTSLAVIAGVQSLSRLETASYHIERVITAESGQGPLGFLFGDKLLLIAYGQVVAGVDLSKIGPDSLNTTGGVVYVRMPAAEVFSSYLDNNRTYVYDRRTGVAGLNMQLESAARLEAERLIMQTAVEDGLLETAEENAQSVLRSLILGMGFEQVIFVELLPTPTAIMTATLSPQ